MNKKNKESFVLYTPLLEITKDLSDTKLGKLLRAILKNRTSSYAGSDLESDVKIAFNFVVNQFRLDDVKYDKFVDKQTDNGKKGGRPKKPKETQKTQAFFSKPKKPYTDTDTDTDTENINTYSSPTPEQSSVDGVSKFSESPKKERQTKTFEEFLQTCRDIFVGIFKTELTITSATELLLKKSFSDGFSESFSLFWVIYPTRNKVRQGKQKSWIIFNGFSKDKKVKALRGAFLLRGRVGSDYGFAKDSYLWLKSEMWLDEFDLEGGVKNE